MAEFGFVVGTFVRPEGDPTTPGLVPSTGEILFSFQEPRRSFPSVPAVVENREVRAPLDTDGRVLGLADGDGPRPPRVKLAVGRWTVRGSLSEGPRINAFQIDVGTEHTEDAPLEIALHMPAIPQPGKPLPPSEETAIRAEAAAGRAEGAAGRAESAATGAGESAGRAESAATAAAGSAGLATVAATDAARDAGVAADKAREAAGSAGTAAADARAAADHAEGAAGSARSAGDSATAAAGAATAAERHASDVATARAEVLAAATRAEQARDAAEAAASRAVQAAADAVAAAPQYGVGTLTAGASAGSIVLVAHGDVTAQVEGLVKAGAVEHVASLPAGFRPSIVSGHGFLVDQTGAWWPAHVTPTQVIVSGPPPVGTVLHGSLTWKAAT